jgi:hypothetical protein
MTLGIACGWTVYVFVEAVPWRAPYAVACLVFGLIAAFASLRAPGRMPSRTRIAASICLPASGLLMLGPVHDMVAHVVGIGLSAIFFVWMAAESRRLEAATGDHAQA